VTTTPLDHSHLPAYLHDDTALDLTPHQARATLTSLRQHADELHAHHDRLLIDLVLTGDGNPHDVTRQLAAHRQTTPAQWVEETPVAARLRSIAAQPDEPATGWFDAVRGLWG